MRVELEIEFETYRPISQGLGMQFWSMGEHFRSMPGHSNYRLRSTGDAETIQAAVDGLAAQIEQTVTTAYPDWPLPRITSIAANLAGAR